MGSRRTARTLLVVGFLAAWIGYNAALVSHVVLDPHTTRAAAHALLEAPAVQRSLADEVTREIDRQVPAAAQNPRIAAATKTALRDPRVVNAFADTIEQMHTSILSATPRTSFTVDGRPLSAAVRDALVRSDPQLAAQVARAGPLNLTIKTDTLPKLHNAKSTADALAILGIAAALLFVTASQILVHDRRAFGRVGRRVAYLALDAHRSVRVAPAGARARAGRRASDRGGTAAGLRQPDTSVGRRSDRRRRRDCDRGAGLAASRFRRPRHTRSVRFAVHRTASDPSRRPRPRPTDDHREAVPVGQLPNDTAKTNTASDRPPTTIPNQARPVPSFFDFAIRCRATQPHTIAGIAVNGFGMNENSPR